MDKTHAMLPQRLGTDGQRDAPAVDNDGGFAIGVMEARKNLDQRRLARPVLAKQAMDFAMANRQTDIVECFDAAEALVEPVNLQNDSRIQRFGTACRRGAYCSFHSL